MKAKPIDPTAVSTVSNTTLSFDDIEKYLEERGFSLLNTGKVRNTYRSPLDDKIFISIATNRLSAFNKVAKQEIPYKGQVLNLIAAHALEEVKDICPIWLKKIPNNNTSIGVRCIPIMLEMVIRGYLAGHALREYEEGKRIICGVPLPEGMKKNQKFDSPIITPTRKTKDDEDISKEQAIKDGIVTAQQYEQLERVTRELFKRGTEVAAAKGLILVDTKYEFGVDEEGKIILIDEVHTPDSSRYWEAKNYQECFDQGLDQEQLSKEFFREWLLKESGYKKGSDDELPKIPIEITDRLSKLYIGLYERITGNKFEPQDFETAEEFCEKF